MRPSHLALAAVLLAIAPVYPASAARTNEGPGRKERAEDSYQRGVGEYAAGRFDSARTDFARALRLDPRHRAARTSLARLDAETRGREAPGAAARAARPSMADDPTLLDSLGAFLDFEDTLGNAARDQGEAQAELGRLAQWTAERRVARAQGRAYPRGAELLALSRRLPSLLRG